MGDRWEQMGYNISNWSGKDRQEKICALCVYRGGPPTSAEPEEETYDFGFQRILDVPGWTAHESTINGKPFWVNDKTEAVVWESPNDALIACRKRAKEKCPCCSTKVELRTANLWRLSGYDIRRWSWRDTRRICAECVMRGGSPFAKAQCPCCFLPAIFEKQELRTAQFWRMMGYDTPKWPSEDLRVVCFSCARYGPRSSCFCPSRLSEERRRLTNQSLIDRLIRESQT